MNPEALTERIMEAISGLLRVDGFGQYSAMASAKVLAILHAEAGRATQPDPRTAISRVPFHGALVPPSGPYLLLSDVMSLLVAGRAPSPAGAKSCRAVLDRMRATVENYPHIEGMNIAAAQLIAQYADELEAALRAAPSPAENQKDHK